MTSPDLIADLERIAAELPPDLLRELNAGALEEKITQLLVEYLRLKPLRDAEPDVFDDIEAASELLKDALRLSLADKRRVNTLLGLLIRREESPLHPDGLGAS